MMGAHRKIHLSPTACHKVDVMNEEQLERYCRHILLPEIDIAGQEKLLQSSVLIIGMGGLGAPAAMYLASSGIGHLIICDDDQVELNNIQRQIIYHTGNIGQQKVDAARKTLSDINPHIKIETIGKRLNSTNLAQQVRRADVIIDSSDNFSTRFDINTACVNEKKPQISGAVVRFTGQVCVFRNDLYQGPCYHCLYPDLLHEHQETQSCHQAGVLAPVAGVIGTIVCSEALKLLLHIGDINKPYLLKFDALTMALRKTSLVKDPKCPVCSISRKNNLRTNSGALETSII
jgi:molybdopterin-synthase adenylyltransferase